MATRKRATTTTSRSRATASEQPVDPSKIEIVRLDIGCGWCLTGDHANCKQELVYPPKNWICGCKVCKMADYVPKIGVEIPKVAKTKAKTEEETEEENE